MQARNNAISTQNQAFEAVKRDSVLVPAGDDLPKISQVSNEDGEKDEDEDDVDHFMFD